MPNAEHLKLDILRELHDGPLGGHQGVIQTVELVSRTYNWKEMGKFVKDYVKSCDQCTRAKNRNHKPFGLLQPLPVPEAPWEEISLDLVVKLPESEGFDSVLVVVCRLTKMVHLIACKEAISTEQVADLFVENIYRLHGLPKAIVRDRGTHFTSKF